MQNSSNPQAQKQLCAAIQTLNVEGVKDALGKGAIASGLEVFEKEDGLGPAFFLLDPGADIPFLPEGEDEAADEEALENFPAAMEIAELLAENGIDGSLREVDGMQFVAMTIMPNSTPHAAAYAALMLSGAFYHSLKSDQEPFRLDYEMLFNNLGGDPVEGYSIDEQRADWHVLLRNVMLLAKQRIEKPETAWEKWMAAERETGTPVGIKVQEWLDSAVPELSALPYPSPEHAQAIAMRAYVSRQLLEGDEGDDSDLDQIVETMRETTQTIQVESSIARMNRAFDPGNDPSPK